MDEQLEEQRLALGMRVQQARLERGWSKEQASREAGISSITWKRVEDGLGVQDHKRYAVLRALGLDAQGRRPVTPPGEGDQVAG